MKGEKNLSPKKYIETKTRMLPVYKCWISPEWETAGLADVIVSRRHSNGHLTAGVYLVDLKCLGIKDTFYFFNEPEEDLREKLHLDSSFFSEIDYPLAHNIIYAGHDFAAEFGIHPHKDFAVTKYILEEDTEAVPLIEVPTGDEEGKPFLVVSSDYNYRPVLEKLKKHAGEGNYHFLIGDAPDNWELGTGADTDFDEDD